MGKPIELQLKEINGKIAFERGLYHNESYESMMKQLVSERHDFECIKKERISKDQ